MEDQLPDVLEGRIQPGRVFHRVIGLDGVPIVLGRSAGLRADDPIPAQMTTLRRARELPQPMRGHRDESVSVG